MAKLAFYVLLLSSSVVFAEESVRCITAPGLYIPSWSHLFIQPNSGRPGVQRTEWQVTNAASWEDCYRLAIDMARYYQYVPDQPYTSDGALIRVEGERRPIYELVWWYARTSNPFSNPSGYVSQFSRREEPREGMAFRDKNGSLRLQGWKTAWSLSIGSFIDEIVPFTK